jgi:drug/metabolite transporter (DMT)-like permease
MGFVFVIIAACSFGAMPIFARFAYASGVDPNTLLAVRFLIATCVIVPFTRLLGLKWPKGRDFWTLCLLGGVGFFFEALTFFYALKHASTGMVTLLLYLYPTLVALVSVLFMKESMSATKMMAIVLALLGLTLTVSLDGQNTLLGIALGLSSAFIYAGFVIGSSRITQRVHPIASSCVIISSAALSYTLLVSFKGIHLPVSALGWWSLVAIGTVSTVVAILSFLLGARMIGATRASVVATIEPLITLSLATVVLHENITSKQMTGGVLILSSCVLLAVQRPVPKKTYVQNA